MSLWQLTFSTRIPYSPHGDLIIPIYLSSNTATQVVMRVKLDIGSTFCVFQPYYASLLGIDLESGEPKHIRTATGSSTAYGHEVTLTVGNLEWQAVVYFAADEAFPVNVVGRVGFLDRLRLGLVDYDQLIYLSDYNE